MTTLRAMGTGRRRNRAEMIFIIVLAILCAFLTALQYRWTGELAEAERERLTKSLLEQSKKLCRAFDSELAESCSALVPSADELDLGTKESVHVERLRRWKSSEPLPIFKRLAVAVPQDGDLDLFEVGIESEKFAPIEWPDSWADLEDNLLGKLSGGSPMYADSAGFLMEIPVMEQIPRRKDDGPGGGRSFGKFDRFEFGGPSQPNGPGGPGGGGARQWFIAELDSNFIRNIWLPELIATYLNSEERMICDVTVRTKVSGNVIFSTRTTEGKMGAEPLMVNFNLHGLVPGTPGGRPKESFWVLETIRREGALEAAVSGSRARNLTVAVMLNLLIIACGYMLLRVTRKSRTLAEEQMKFVANVTHELRTPLTVIRGAAHNMKRGIVKDQEGVAKYSGLILDHAQALGDMVEQVLDFSGVQQGQIGSERQPVDVGEMLRAASSTAMSGGRFPGCEVDLQLPESIPTVTGDPGALRRVFINLIENAAKHGGAGGWIGVSVEVLERRIAIKVADHGPGIPVEEQREIFTPFYRGGIARSYQVRGSGLGLSLVKEIVTAHAGVVSVDSETGKGSVFTVVLPFDPSLKQ